MALVRIQAILFRTSAFGQLYILQGTIGTVILCASTDARSRLALPECTRPDAQRGLPGQTHASRMTIMRHSKLAPKERAD